MNEELLIQGANAVSMFCRQNIKAKKDLPVRSSEIGLLIYAAKAEKPVTPLDAAHFFQVSKPMVAGMVKSLSAKGYLTKRPSPTDKRSFILSPTEKARQLVESVYDEYFKTMRSLLEEMGRTKFEKMISLLDEANAVLQKGNG